MSEEGVWRTIRGHRVFISKDGIIHSKYKELNGKKLTKKKSQKLEEFRNMSTEELDRLYNKIFSMNKQPLRDEGLNAESRFQRLVYELGLNDKPRVLSPEEFDKELGDDRDAMIYRGVRDVETLDSNMKTNVLTAKEIHDQMKYGDKTYIGNGSFGDGLYFTDSQITAKKYGGDDIGNVVTAFLNEKAKVIDFDTLSQMRNDYYKNQFEPGAEKVSYMFSDISSFALYKGYNVIAADGGFGENYLNVLDRSVLTIREDDKNDK